MATPAAVVAPSPLNPLEKKKKRQGLSLIEDEFWYTGPLSEKKAEQILCRLGEPGSFLVRDSLLPDADFVLSVNSGKEIWHYDIQMLPNNECIFNNYTFTNLPAAIEFYTENRLGTVFLEMPDCPVISDCDFPRDIGPAIRVARSSTLPRATRIHRSPPNPYHDVTYDTIDGPLVADLKSKPWQEAAGTADSGYLPSSATSSSNHSPEQPGATHKHFVFNSNPDVEEGSKHNHTYATPPASGSQIESMYIHPLDIETTTTTLDHILDEKCDVKEKDDEVFETRFDSDNSATTVVTASIDTQPTNHQPSKVMHVTSENGQIYAVPTKRGVTSQEVDEDMPTTFKPRSGNTQITNCIPEGPPINSSTLKIGSKTNPMYRPPLDHAILKPPENPKEEQIAELRKLPSILHTKLELERKLKGENSEDETLVKSPGDSPVSPRRVSVPEVLQNMPSPPPMSTHPGLTRQPPTEKVEVKTKTSFRLKNKSSKNELESKKSTPEEGVSTDRPTSAGRRKPSRGVPTPMAPTVEGQQNEFHAVFKNICKRESGDTVAGNDILVPMTPVLTPSTSAVIRSKGSSISLPGYTNQPSSLQQVVPGLKGTLSHTPLQKGVLPLELRRASTPVISRANPKVPEGFQAPNTAPMNTKRQTKKRKSFRKRKSEAALN